MRQLIEESPEAPSLDKRETDVTVLFADITGYTRLSARLAPDDLDALVERYFGAFLDEIVKHGGDVNETAGDGLMVIFHEGDHAAGRGGGGAVPSTGGPPRSAPSSPGASSRSRCTSAINTGPASLGATKIEGRAGTRWTYTASGMTTNLAARLAAEAAAGEVLLSESTLARFPDGLPVDDLGTREVKNVDRPREALPAAAKERHCPVEALRLQSGGAASRACPQT